MMLVGSRVRASRLVRWRDALLVLMVAGLLCGSGLSLRWAAATMVLLALVAVLLQVWPQQRLCQIDQMDDRQWRWQMQGSDHRYRGCLMRVEHWPSVVVLHVYATVPYARKQRLVLWRDQVDATAWRRLQVLARFYGQNERV
jgi:hypothetical protein